MRGKSGRAFWKTLLFFALAGPLVGLLCLIVISFVIEAWGPVTDRLAALIPHAPDPACLSRDPRHVDLRCFQRNDPRPLPYPHGPISVNGSDLGLLALVLFGTYYIGFVPATVAGLLICAGRFHGFGAGFIFAFGVGALVGFVLGAMALFKLENAIALFLVCLVSTIVCWFITRRWWHAAGAAAPEPAACG